MEKQHSEPSKAVLGGHLESKDQGANQHGQKAQAEMLLLQMGGCSCSWNTNELIVTMHYGCTMGILHCGFATHPGATTQRMGIILTSVFLHLCPWKRAPMCVFYRSGCKMCDNALPPHCQRVCMSDTSQIQTLVPPPSSPISRMPSYMSTGKALHHSTVCPVHVTANTFL